MLISAVLPPPLSTMTPRADPRWMSRRSVIRGIPTSSGTTLIPQVSNSIPNNPSTIALYHPVAQFRFETAPCRFHASGPPARGRPVYELRSIPEPPEDDFHRTEPSHDPFPVSRPAEELDKVDVPVRIPGRQGVLTSASRIRAPRRRVPCGVWKFFAANRAIALVCPRVRGTPRGDCMNISENSGYASLRLPVDELQESRKKPAWIRPRTNSRMLHRSVRRDRVPAGPSPRLPGRTQQISRSRQNANSVPVSMATALDSDRPNASGRSG